MGHKSYFIWKGVDCRSKGVILESPAPIVKPEERVSHVTIPGRDGELTLLEGEGIYNSYIQTVTVHVYNARRVREVINWLKGSGYVTFSGEPDRRQKARVIGAVTLEKHSANLDVWSGEVQFYCEPVKEALKSSAVTVSSSGTTVYNTGDLPSKPLITVTTIAQPSGQIVQPDVDISITVGGKTLNVYDLDYSTVYKIDCETEIITNAAGTENVTAQSGGTFPVLAPGSNTITGSNWASMVIDRRERFL